MLQWHILPKIGRIWLIQRLWHFGETSFSRIIIHAHSKGHSGETVGAPHIKLWQNYCFYWTLVLFLQQLTGILFYILNYLLKSCTGKYTYIANSAQIGAFELHCLLTLTYSMAKVTAMQYIYCIYSLLMSTYQHKSFTGQFADYTLNQFSAGGQV